MRRLVWALAPLASVAGLLAASPVARACDWPSAWYDPVHEVCQAFPPSQPQPGYPQACSDPWLFYDPEHQICAPYAPNRIAPNYPWARYSLDRPDLSPPPGD